MKSILLIGLGRFGTHVAKKLSTLNHQVMAVDSDEERVNEVLPYVTNAQIGDSFQDSLETASLLKELGAKYVFARAATDVQEKFLLRNGADEVVYPEKQLAAWTAIRCTSDHILDYVELNEDYSIFELAVPEEWQGKTVMELDLRKKYGINILSIRENGSLNMEITPDTVLTTNRTILVLGRYKSIQKCFHI